MQQCTTSSSGKIKKKSGTKFGAKRAKIRPKISFFCHFLKLGSLVFLEVAYNDNLQQCTTSSRGTTYEKKVGRTNLGQNGPKSGPKFGFCYFLKFGSLHFLEIAYSLSLQQCITSSRGKTYKKALRDQIWCKKGQNPPQNRCFCNFFKFNLLVFLKMVYSDSLQQCITSSRGQTYEKKIGGPNLGQNGPKSLVFGAPNWVQN